MTRNMIERNEKRVKPKVEEKEEEGKGEEEEVREKKGEEEEPERFLQPLKRRGRNWRRKGGKER